MCIRDSLQSLRWTNIAPTGWTAGTNVTTDIVAPNNMVEQTYLRQHRITDVIASQVRSIDVRVSWTEPNGNARTYTVSSQRFNYEGL